MPYQVTLRKRAIKALQTLSEPYYSNIKEAIYKLADNPRPPGYKKLKAVTAFVFVYQITELFMIFLMIPLL